MCTRVIHRILTGYTQCAEWYREQCRVVQRPCLQRPLRLATDACRRGGQSQRPRYRARCREGSKRVYKETARGAERHSTNTFLPIFYSCLLFSTVPIFASTVFSRCLLSFSHVVFMIHEHCAFHIVYHTVLPRV